MKICRTCKILKSLEDFYKNSQLKDGRQTGCKLCQSLKAKSPEVRTRSNEKRRIRRQDPEFRAKELAKDNIRRQTPEFKAKRSAQQKTHRQRPEVKKRNAELQRINNQRPEVIENRKKWQKTRRQCPEINEKIKASKRICNQKPKAAGKIRERDRDRYHNQKPEVKAKQKNKNKIRNQRPEVKERRSQQGIERRKADIQFKLSHDARTRRWEVLKRCGSPKYCSFIEALGCTIQEWEIHLQKNMPIHSQTKTKATWKDFLSTPAKLHIDEIIPCTAWDLSDPLQYKLCFHYSNSQLLWADDNMRKAGYKRNPEYYDRLVAEKIKSAKIS